MTDLKLSGYLASAATITLSGTQTLASLTNGEWTDLSDALNNSSDLAFYEDLEIVLGSAAFTGAGSALRVYLLPSVDGSNYPDWTGNVTSEEPENEQYYVGEVSTSQSTAAQRLVLRDIALPNGLYKYGFRNATGVTLAASGNTVSYRRHRYMSV